jgi:hypothetical protein
MGTEKEIEAMASVVGILDELEEDARERVIRWLADKYGAVTARKSLRPASAGVQQSGGDGDQEFEDVGSFFHAAEPSNNPECALVVGYWLQEVEGEDNIDAQQVNKQLKHLGHGIGNITRAFESLMNRRPALAIQIRKTGKTRQARKKYKITTAGKAEVQRMIGGRDGANEN